MTSVGDGKGTRAGGSPTWVFPMSSVLVFTIAILVNFHDAYSANTNLFVSAENTMFSNEFGGPQVIEVIVVDSDISKTNIVQGEPDVTVNGKKLRMAQDVNGNWHGFFADKTQAQNADNTVGLPGTGMDFGVFCAQNTTMAVLGVSYSDTAGVAIPNSSGVIKSTNGNDTFTECGGSPDGANSPQNNVVRKPVALNPGGGGVLVGQTGIDVDSWPTIQLYNFTPAGNVIIQYIKGGGAQSTTLTFDSISSLVIGLKGNSPNYEVGSQVDVTLTDPQLNIDPTDNDSWTWSTESGNEGMFYQAFDKNGANDANGGPGLVNQIGNLNDLMLGGRMLTTNFVSNGISIADLDTNSIQPIWFISDGVNKYSKIITFVENKTPGLFVNFDSKGDSNIDIPAVVKTSNSASIIYKATTDTFRVVASQVSNEHLISFKSGERGPPAGIDINAIRGSLAATDTVHFLIQFNELKDASVLSGTGINLLDYATGRAYVVSSKVSDLPILLSLPGIRWAGPLNVDDKMDHVLKLGKIPPWAITSKDGNAVLTIYFHKDVDPKVARDLIFKLGGTPIETVESIPFITAAFSNDKINEIASQDLVQFVDVIMPPLSGTADEVKMKSGVTRLKSTPYSLEGEGTTVLIYDEGKVFPNVDFDGRLRFVGPQIEGSMAHATNVAGILGGDGRGSGENGGSNRQWAGMAPGIGILSANVPQADPGGSVYNDPSNLRDIINDHRSEIDLVTMSLAHNIYEKVEPSSGGVGQDPDTYCPYIGDYKAVATLIDREVHSDQITFFEAAGNEHKSHRCDDIIRSDSSYYNPDPRFYYISSPATAKNSIAVGVVHSDDNGIAIVSSSGPTDYGRLKPDITAPGCHSEDEGIKTTSDTDEGYARLHGCFTSYSTPVASGVAALLIQEWKQKHGDEAPLPQTVKAILIHTAIDRGNPGPDYIYGWGVIDATKAANLVMDSTDDPPKAKILTDRMNGDSSIAIPFSSLGVHDVKATLVWDDPPPDPAVSRELVNDLDLKLVDPTGVRYNPYVLDPANPGNVARTDIGIGDHLNNVEMVTGAKKSGPWIVEIDGRGISRSPQGYTLIISEYSASSTGTSTTSNSATGPTTNTGCLIATAAFGSEMAPQVQHLRETRDNIVMKTESGAAFMASFNSVYYTFAPTVSGWEQQNPVFKEMVKITIIPLLSTLSILNYLDINSEPKMITYGISIILLNIGMYFVAPGFIIFKLNRFLKKKN